MGQLSRESDIYYGDQVLTLSTEEVPPWLRGQTGTVIETDYYGSGLVLVALQVSFEVFPGGKKHAKDRSSHKSKYFTFRPENLWRESRSILHELPEQDRKRYE